MIEQKIDRGFDFIPGAADRDAASPADLIASGALARVFEKLTKSYQLIIVDTSALVDYIDDQAIVHLSASTIMVVESAKTTGDEIWLALRRLAGTEHKLLGFALNNAEHSPQL